MGEQHGLGPGHAGVRIQPVDDQSLAILTQRTGIQPQSFEDLGKFRAALGQSREIHFFHGLGGPALLLVGLHGLHKNTALADFRDLPENGRKGVAFLRRGMHGQTHARIDQRLFFDAFHQLETFAVKPHKPRLGSCAEALRHPVEQMETGVVQHLK